MIILGLTGSIGMGKTAAARNLRRLGVAVQDADAEVHRLMKCEPTAIAAVEAAFPGVVRQGIVDRAELGRRVFANAVALRRLEAVLHPLVRHSERRFLGRARRDRRDIVVLDIPLLYETGAERRVDAVVVVSAPPFVQLGRVLRRQGMTPGRLAAIAARQMPDGCKRRRADFVVPTGLDRRTSLRAIAKTLYLLRTMRHRRRLTGCSG